MMLKILHLPQNKKKYLKIDERREKITDLDKKVNSHDLIYRYKGNTADVKFDDFNNGLDIINKTQNGEISLVDVKNNQQKFKSYLVEIKKGNKEHRSKEQKTLCTTLKCFPNRETKLSNFIMIIR